MRKLVILWVTGLLGGALFWTSASTGPRIVKAGTQVRPTLLPSEGASRPQPAQAGDGSSYNYFHLMATEGAIARPMARPR